MAFVLYIVLSSHQFFWYMTILRQKFNHRLTRIHLSLFSWLYVIPHSAKKTFCDIWYLSNNFEVKRGSSIFWEQHTNIYTNELQFVIQISIYKRLLSFQQSNLESSARPTTCFGKTNASLMLLHLTGCAENTWTNPFLYGFETPSTIVLGTGINHGYSENTNIIFN